MHKTNWKQKCLLVLFGVLLTFLLLEAGLHIGGVVFLWFQEHINKISIEKNGEYRILCLGESTTALGGNFSYPRQLENILNSAQKNIRFSVINKGIPSTTTTQIVMNLDKNLDQ